MVSWVQPLHFGENRSCGQAIVEAAECVLYLGRKYQQVHKVDEEGNLHLKKKVSTDSKCICFLKVTGKITLNCTVIIPLIALTIKAGYRCRHNFIHQEPEEKNFIEPEEKNFIEPEEKNFIDFSSFRHEELCAKLKNIAENIKDDKKLKLNRNNYLQKTCNFFYALEYLMNPTSLREFQDSVKDKPVYLRNFNGQYAHPIGGIETIEAGDGSDLLKEFLVHLDVHLTWDAFYRVYFANINLFVDSYNLAELQDQKTNFLNELASNAFSYCIEGCINETQNWAERNLNSFEPKKLDKFVGNYVNDGKITKEQMKQLLQHHPKYLNENDQAADLTEEIVNAYVDMIMG